MGLQATGVRHLGDLPSAFFDGKLVQGERSGLILDLQVPLIDPHRHVFPVQPPFTIKAPVLEFHEAVAINLASELRGVQGPGEPLSGCGVHPGASGEHSVFLCCSSPTRSDAPVGSPARCALWRRRSH